METRQATIVAVSTFFFSFSSIFVAFYFTSCLFVVKKLRLPEYLMFLAWMLDFGMAFSLFYAVGKGFGLHTRQIKPQNEVALNKATYVFQVLYDPTSMAAKSSVLVFFQALTHKKKTFYWANYITLFVVLAVGLALTIDQILRCHPISAGFRFDTLETDCDGVFPSFLGSSPYNIATDVAILLIPIPLLTRMVMPWRQKLILVVTFGIAVLVIVVDVIRIAFLENTAIEQLRATHGTKVGDVGNKGYTFDAAMTFMLSFVEVNKTIICACVPSLKPLATRISPSILGTTKEASSQSKKQGNNNNNSQPQSQSSGGNVPREMIEHITSHPELGPYTKTTEETRDPYRPDMPIINVLNMRPASIPRLNRKESLLPNMLVSILFSLWGFSYGLINVLNIRFRYVANLSEWESDGLHAAYFGGYLVGPLLVGRLILRRFGFAATFIAGLYIYACGTLLFWPSAVLGSVPTFIVSNLVTGAGLGLLETTANLFVAICGPLEYSEVRLCVAQAFEGIGETTALALGQKVIFRGSGDVSEVVKAQWTGLGVAFFDVLLSIIFYYLPVPEASDDELKELGDRRPENRAVVLGLPVFGITLGLGIWSQFLYVAGQEVHNVSFVHYVQTVKPGSAIAPSDYQIIGNAVFTIGRLLTAFIQWLFLKPRWTLLILYTAIIIFAVLSMYTTGSVGVAMTIMVFVFESGIFPIIFAISLRGTAQHAKTAATFLAAAISGGAFFPFAQHAAALAHDHHHAGNRGEPYSFRVLVALWCAGAIFPLYLNMLPAAKRQVDPRKGEFLQWK